MAFDFQVVRLEHLQPLAWLGIIHPGKSAKVYVGKRVEVGPHYIIEGVWDGPFGDGFTRSMAFFGSGLSVVDDELWAIPSIATIDSLTVVHDGDRIYVSNSNVLMLAYTGAKLRPDHDYRHESFDINDGVEAFDPTFLVDHPSLSKFETHYYMTLIFSKDGMRIQDKGDTPEFDDYASLTGAIRQTVARIFTNAKDPARAFPVHALTTLSTGYDSTYAASLAAPHGVECAFTSKQSSIPLPGWLIPRANDDGTPIARTFDIPVRYLEAKSNTMSEDEVWFLSTCRADSEAVFDRMLQYIRDQASPSMVFTGYNGSVFDPKMPGMFLQGDIMRHGSSGRSVAEARLVGGWFNVAVIFLFIRRAKAIFDITNSDEMKPWSLPGDYNKPIPRRVAEESGVDRSLFGQRKNGVSTNRVLPLNPVLRKRFFAYLQQEHGLSEAFVLAHQGINASTYRARRLAVLLKHKGNRDKTLKIYTPRRILRSNLDVTALLYQFAVQEAAAKLGPALAEMARLNDEEHRPR